MKTPTTAAAVSLAAVVLALGLAAPAESAAEREPRMRAVVWTSDDSGYRIGSIPGLGVVASVAPNPYGLPCYQPVVYVSNNEGKAAPICQPTIRAGEREAARVLRVIADELTW